MKKQIVSLLLVLCLTLLSTTAPAADDNGAAELSEGTEHTHNWGYSVTNNTITAYCTVGGSDTPSLPGSNDDGNTPANPPATEDNTPAYTTYTIQRDDTLWAIAKKHGCTVPEIVAANSDLIQNPNRIYVGWKLKVPQD